MRAPKAGNGIAAGLVAAVGIVAALVTGDGGEGVDATHAEAVQCTELAVWSLVVGTHGEDGAREVWDALTGAGWTNPRSGETTYLVQPGCADAWNV